MSEWLAPNRTADKHQASNPGLPLSTVHALKVNSWFGDTELVIGKIMCLPSTQWGQESSIPTLPFPLKALGYRWNSRHQTWKEIWGGHSVDPPGPFSGLIYNPYYPHLDTHSASMVGNEKGYQSLSQNVSTHLWVRRDWILIKLSHEDF